MSKTTLLPALQVTDLHMDADLFDEDQGVSPLPEPEPGFLPLGMADGRAIVFSLHRKAVVKLAASDLREVTLKLILGAKWFDDLALYLQRQRLEPGTRATKTTGLSLVVNHILYLCQAAGNYVPGTERKTGVWRDEEGSSLVINGSSLWRSDGSVLTHGIHGQHVYPLGQPMGYGPGTPVASPEDVEKVLQVFRSYDWMLPGAAELVLGWLGIAVAAGAMRRRPHLLIVGPAGCGKSTLLEHIGNLLGPNVSKLTGSPSWMGLHQLVHDRPTQAITLDEFEADGQSKRCQDAFEAARGSYSALETDSGVVRGSPEGQARQYHMCSPFAAAAISPGRMEPADLTRWLVLEARRRPLGGLGDLLLTKAETDELSPRLARLFIARWPVFSVTLEIMRAAIRSRGGDARMSDTHGHLLASYWAFTHDQEATAEEAEELLERTGIAAQLKTSVVPDEEECLTALLTRVVTFNCSSTGGASSTKLSIGQALARVTQGHPDARAIEGELSKLGLRVGLSGGRWVLLVANSHNHAELRKLFQGTKWAGGGWGLVLRRLPGGRESTQRLAPGLLSCKVTVVDVPPELQPSSSGE